MKTKVTVKQDEENEIALEIMAEAIVKISSAVEIIKNSRLTKRTILLLIHDNCAYCKGYPRKKPTVKEIETVLDSIESLKKVYIKQPVKK